MLTDEEIRHAKQAHTIEYGAQLDALQARRLLTAKQVGDMKAAFVDGCNAMIATCRAASKKPPAKKKPAKAAASKGASVRRMLGL